jgi:DNA-binding MarR family transcriptional regulator
MSRLLITCAWPQFKWGVCPTPSKMDAHEGLSELELLVLRAIPHAGKIEDLTELTKQPPATVGRTIAKLQIGGYIGDNGDLTEKGKEAAGK